MPSQYRSRRLAAALVLTAGLALTGCSAGDDGSAAEEAAAQAQAQADALRAELTAFVLPGGEEALEPSALSGVDEGAGYHAETLFAGRSADGETLIGEAAAALEATGLALVTTLPDGSQVPTDPGPLATGYWGGGDWIVGAQAGVRLEEDGAQSGDLVLQYVFLSSGAAEPASAAGE